MSKSQSSNDFVPSGCSLLFRNSLTASISETTPNKNCFDWLICGRCRLKGLRYMGRPAFISFILRKKQIGKLFRCLIYLVSVSNECFGARAKVKSHRKFEPSFNACPLKFVVGALPLLFECDFKICHCGQMLCRSKRKLQCALLVEIRSEIAALKELAACQQSARNEWRSAAISEDLLGHHVRQVDVGSVGVNTVRRSHRVHASCHDC